MGGFGGLSSSSKAPHPQNWNMKHHKSVEILPIFKMSRPCTNVKAPYWRLSGDGSDTGSVLTCWLRDFLNSCMRQVKIPRIWTRTLIVAIPKSEKPLGTQRAIALYPCCVSPSRSSRDSSTLVLNQLPTHYSRRDKRAFTREVDRRWGHLTYARYWG